MQAFPELSDTRKLQDYCRGIAERQRAGIVEVTPVDGANGPCLTYIYKRPDCPALTFFGVVYVPAQRNAFTWMIVAYERGITGVREAVVTARMLEAGE
jgi:hypothetical protein